MVVEIELEQSQVVGAKVSAEGEVVPQTTVEIFDEGTGAYGAVGHIADGFADVVEAIVELLAATRSIAMPLRVEPQLWMRLRWMIVPSAIP